MSDLKRQFPFYPLTSVGMPLPGPDFVAVAESLGAKGIKYDKNERGRYLKSSDVILDDLYYDALYKSGFFTRIIVKTRPATPVFIRGHLWGYEVSGPRRSKVMVLGKWPGQDEMKMNRNMVGPSGVIMIDALESIGVTKEEYDDWYVTNLIKFPNIDPSGNRVVKTWLNDCLPLLEQELRLVRPDFILALGAEAAKALIGDEFRFDTAQGQIFKRNIRLNFDYEPTIIKEAKVIACIHPAFVARQPDRLPEFVDTLRRFTQLIRGEDVGEKEEVVDHRVIWNEDELSKLVDEILKEETGNEQPIIALDCEWHGEFPTNPGAWLRTIQFSHKPNTAACVVLRKCGGADAFRPNLLAALPHLRRLLVSTPTRQVRIAGHHLRADLPWILEGYDKELGQALLKQYDGAETSERTRTEGGFDTMAAAHAVTESPGPKGFKLEVLASRVLGTKRYDAELLKWKKENFKEDKLDGDAANGYGHVPDELLHKYALYDADVTRRLVEIYNKPGGLLDKDQYGNNSREAFWESMKAAPAILEMEMRGILIDKPRGEELTATYTQAKEELVAKIQKLANWPTFNHNSSPQCRTLLFGYMLSGSIDKDTGKVKNVAPEGAIQLDLEPVKTSGKPSKNWEQVVRRREEHLYGPAADKEVLGILRMQLKEKVSAEPENEQLKNAHDIVETLRNVRFAGHVIKSVLRPPVWDEEGKSYELDENDDLIYEKGLLSNIQIDGRVRTHIFATLETGRFSSSRPNLTNISKSKESVYKEILGSSYNHTLRSMITTTPGYALVETDIISAELMTAAIQANDLTLIDHCLRAALPTNDSRYFDTISSLTVQAFKLDCPPTKAGLASVGKDNLRTATKSVLYGSLYSRGIPAIVRAVEQEGVRVTNEEAQAIHDTIYGQYSQLTPYFELCENRVATPGWIASCYKRYRRFQSVGNDEGGELKRQARNFTIQSPVASIINRALVHLYSRPDRFTSSGDIRYYHLLQIHDALLFEVRIPDIEWFVDAVLPWAITEKVDVHRCDLDGNHLSEEAFHMGIDTAVYLHWGEKIPHDVGTSLGIPARFCAKPKS
jgi:uracil-DNA glycosylase family 4